MRVLFVVILGAVVLVACGMDNVALVPLSKTQQMAAHLKDIWYKQNVVVNTYLNSRRVEYLRRQEPLLDPVNRLRARALFARELLRAGQTLEAIEEFHLLEPEFKRRTLTMQPSLATLLGVAYMRLGEIENCLELHGTESCLLPIGPAGVHVKRRGSQAAVEAFTKVLDADPDDLTARWLLNIMYMTLGEYPAKVPPAWLIPPQLFEADYDIGHFVDIAPSVGLDLVSLAGGCILDDFDGDADLDLMISSWDLQEPLRYFRNDQNGSFSEQTAATGLAGITGGLQLVHADYDNNGYLDVLALRGAWQASEGQHPNSLIRNEGNGVFVDATEEAGVLSYHPTQTAAWGDYDNDGWLDLFVGNETVGSDRHPCELFHGDGDGTFTELGEKLGVGVEGYVKGVAWGDIDNDGSLDLYISRMQGDNFLFHNQGQDATGEWNFKEIAAFAGVTQPQESFPVWFWDYDNDGWLDIFVSGYHYNPDINAADVAADYLGLPTDAERARLFRNSGDGTFEDVSEAAGVHKVLYTMGCNFGDLDNDGFLDFYLSTGSPSLRAVMPNRMFRNEAGRFFQDVTASGGFGHLQKGHGVGVGDVDNDGDQDFYTVMGGAYAGDVFQNVFFENPGHGNHWLTLKLQGTHSNRSALGARVKVSTASTNGFQDYYATVTSGASFGASSLQLEMGLGQAKAIRYIEVTWPVTGEIEIFEAVELNKAFSIREGDHQLIELPLQPFKLGSQVIEKASSVNHQNH